MAFQISTVNICNKYISSIDIQDVMYSTENGKMLHTVFPTIKVRSWSISLTVTNIQYTRDFSSQLFEYKMGQGAKI